MTHKEIADCAGLTSVHVKRTLKVFQKHSLIERRTARPVIIGDWENLASAGDFDGTYLHLPTTEISAR